MGDLTVPEAEALLAGFFSEMPPEVLDFVALAWRANEHFEAGDAKAMATVVTAGKHDPTRDMCLRLRAGDINTLRAPYSDGIYAVLDPRELSPGPPSAGKPRRPAPLLRFGYLAAIAFFEANASRSKTLPRRRATSSTSS